MKIYVLSRWSAVEKFVRHTTRRRQADASDDNRRADKAMSGALSWELVVL